MFKKVTVTLVLALLSVVTAQSQIRTYSNEFLSLGVGARALGMGNVQSASADDLTAAYWNPAGLNNVENLQIGAMHAEWFAGIAKYDYLSVATPIGDNKHVIGISAIRFGVDNIPNTLNIIEPDGSVNYDNISTFSAADYAFLLSYARKIKKLDVGANVKIIYRNVGSFANAIGFGLDVGVQYAVNDNFKLGLNVKNLTTTFNAWSFNFTEEEKQVLEITDNVIPVNSVELTGQQAILGVAYNFQIGSKFDLLTALDLDFTFDGKRNTLIKSDFMSIDPHLGIELGYDNLVFLRAGISNIQQFTDDQDGSTFTSMQPNLGLGINIKGIEIDYAFTGLNRVSDGIYSNVVSLIVNVNKKDKSL